MKRKLKEFIRKIKSVITKISNKLFYGKYNNTYSYVNKKSSILEYLVKFLIIFLVIFIIFYLIFNNIISTAIVSFILTIFFINEIMLNAKKISYESYILSQLTIYTSQMSLLIAYNNIYSSLKEVVKFLDYPLNKDIEDVILKIDNGMKITEAFEDFNKKYNNRTITLFNQTLELFDEHGNSDAETVLQIVSEEMNMLKIKKDKFFKFKKEWRLNFYVVIFLCISMPLILRLMINDIYKDFMASFGTMMMIIVILINLVIIKKVEKIYRDQAIGEGGSR